MSVAVKVAIACLGLIVLAAVGLVLVVSVQFVAPQPFTQPTNLLMVGNASWPSTLELKVTGRIDGLAKFTLSSLRFTNRYSVMDRLDWFGPDLQLHRGIDWFETNAVLHYEPRNVKTGYLSVDFNFR
jgi:hypothetical protein